MIIGCNVLEVVRIIVLFFFNDTATTEIYTLSLHDALPISRLRSSPGPGKSGWSYFFPPAAAPARPSPFPGVQACPASGYRQTARSEEHTSELQSRQYLVCRLLLEKKKTYRQSSLSHTITLY